MSVTQQPSDNSLNPTNPKAQTYVVGSLLGLAIGFLAAYFYVRAAEESENADGLQARDFISIGLALLGLVRQITEMGSGGKKQ